MLANLRLMQLLSPVLPVGAYSYSQGLEWAVNEGWVTSRSDFEQWLNELVCGPLAQQELPLLRNIYRACANNDIQSVTYWCQETLAFRDTAESRAEERARATAYLRVLDALPDEVCDNYRANMQQTPFASIAWASVNWHIEEQALLHAFAYNWLDAYIVNGVKIIPLGQSDGQALLHAMLPKLSEAVDTALGVSNESIGFSVPAVAMASCGHEVQYSRVYRS